MQKHIIRQNVHCIQEHIRDIVKQLDRAKEDLDKIISELET